MAGERIELVDVREVIYRLRLRQPQRQISRELSLDRKTVRRYRKLAQERGWLTRPELPEMSEVGAALLGLAETPPPPR